MQAAVSLAACTEKHENRQVKQTAGLILPENIHNAVLQFPLKRERFHEHNYQERYTVNTHCCIEATGSKTLSGVSFVSD